MGMFDDLHKLDVAEQRRTRSARSAAAADVVETTDSPPRRTRATTAQPSSSVSTPNEPRASTNPDRAVLPPSLAIPRQPQRNQADPAPVPGAVRPSAPAAADDEFDLSQMPFRKLTCLLTPAEAREVDLMKLDVSDLLEGNVTKEHLARCAIHFMVVDYKKHGLASTVLRPLRSKTGTR